MAPRRGRPPKPSVIDADLLVAVRKALNTVARDLSTPRSRYPTYDADGHTVVRTEPRAIDLAVLAVSVESALEFIAAEQVAKARDFDEATWEEIGQAFGTSAQSAHVRFSR